MTCTSPVWVQNGMVIYLRIPINYDTGLKYVYGDNDSVTVTKLSDDTVNGFTETYSYDQRGNILTKTKVYDDENTPAETSNFSYGNSSWPDELTSVNGTSLTYDANGNALTYGNMEFEWTNGRVLSEITVNPEDENGTADIYSYTYDESGIRTSKTVNGTTTFFTTKDGVVLSQTDGTNAMYFQYDNSGNPTGFLYNGIQYFYLTNQMGDVIGITDNAGSLVATYTYGAWGEVLATTPATAGDSAQLAIANANPLRYRGYYLDQETGYYYLQSRYYSPLSTRFISSDVLSNVSFVKDEYNSFLYCSNLPVCNSDLSGRSKVSQLLKKYKCKKTKKGFHLPVNTYFLSRPHCISLACAAIVSYGKGDGYLHGMGTIRIAEEVWAHAVGYYVGKGLSNSKAKLSNSKPVSSIAKSLITKGSDMDINYDDSRLPLYKLLWQNGDRVVKAAKSSKNSTCKKYAKYME